MDPVTSDQRRTLIALACRVAWADGVVADEERTYIRQLVQRLGGAAMTGEELDAWLDEGPPAAELETLPEGLGRFFFYEALQLAESDGDLDPREEAMCQEILDRVFVESEKGVGLAKIALKRLPVER